MNFGDPNRPRPGASLREHERFTQSEATGNEGQDGYTVVARRPRVPGMTDTIDPDRAAEIEGMYQRFPPLD